MNFWRNVGVVLLEYITTLVPEDLKLLRMHIEEIDGFAEPMKIKQMHIATVLYIRRRRQPTP